MDIVLFKLKKMIRDADLFSVMFLFYKKSNVNQNAPNVILPTQL